MSTMTTTNYPDCYLHVEECQSGQTWIVPIGEDEPLNLRDQISKWVKREFGGDLELDGEIMPQLQGDYYARIMTDGRPPESIVCWTSGGFWIKWAESVE